MSTPVGPLDASVVPRFAGVRTFARLPLVDDVESVDVAVLGAPFDGGTTFRAGARFGPAAVRESSVLLRSFNPNIGIAPFEAAQVADAGDAFGNPVDIVAAHEAIRSSAAGLIATGAGVIGIGGDHSVSLPLVSAAAERHGPLGLVQLDAHTDTWDAYFGSKLTHGTMFRRAIESGVIDPDRSVQIGLRGSLYSGDDEAANHRLGFRTLTAREFDHDAAIEMVRRQATGSIYLTVDIDVLDPAFAPGTGTPEVGGLTTRELVALLVGIGEELGPRLVGADVVEVSPPYDPTGITALAGANVAYHLVSMLAANR
ncbi:MAG: agmatinase [Actinobacteria bacterium]|nr:agmatinase [Actinomycetota bacterium]